MTVCLWLSKATCALPPPHGCFGAPRVFTSWEGCPGRCRMASLARCQKVLTRQQVVSRQDSSPRQQLGERNRSKSGSIWVSCYYFTLPKSNALPILLISAHRFSHPRRSVCIIDE